MTAAGSLDELHSYVSKRVRLRRTGRAWMGLCPFHDEKHASFGIFEGKRGEGRYHCHGCGADGDLGDWLKEVEHEDPHQPRRPIRRIIPDIREPARVRFLGDDPVAWARHLFPEYDRYCRGYAEMERAEVLRIDELRRLLEHEKTVPLDDGDNNAGSGDRAEFLQWLSAERAAS